MINNIFIDESADEELQEANKNYVNSTPNNRSSYENKPILLFQVPECNSVSPQPSSSTQSPLLPANDNNIHSNQYYDYCPPKKNSEPPKSETPLITEPMSPVPKTTTEPTDNKIKETSPIKSKPEIVSVIQHTNGSASSTKMNLNNSKILIPKKSKSSSKDKQNSSKNNTSENNDKCNKKRSQSPSNLVANQLSSIALNQSGSSGSGMKIFLLLLLSTLPKL